MVGGGLTRCTTVLASTTAGFDLDNARPLLVMASMASPESTANSSGVQPCPCVARRPRLWLALGGCWLCLWFFMVLCPYLLCSLNTSSRPFLFPAKLTPAGMGPLPPVSSTHTRPLLSPCVSAVGTSACWQMLLLLSCPLPPDSPCKKLI